MDYRMELIDMGVDEDRIAATDDYEDLYNTVMDECSEENFPGTDEPVTIEERRAMGDDMLYPTYNIFGEWEN